MTGAPSTPTRCPACAAGECPQTSTTCMMCSDQCDDATSQRMSSAQAGGTHDMRVCIPCMHDALWRYLNGL